MKGWHKNVKVNSNGKGGIKVGSLGFLEIFKAKWHWNNLHKLYIIKGKKYKTKKEKELKELIAMGNVMVEWKLFKGEQENLRQIVKETTKKPLYKTKKKGKEGVRTSKISPPKKTPSHESNNKGGVKANKGLLIKTSSHGS